MLVVVLAQSLKVTRGRKLRIDGTMVEIHIHHPTDSTLLHDGVRVLSRTLCKARDVVKETTTLARHVFRERTHSVKRQMKRIMAATRQRGVQAEERIRTVYQRLLGITKTIVKQAKQVGAGLMKISHF